VIKKILKNVLPVTMGVLIGAGITRNKYAFYIILSIFIFYSLFQLLQDKIIRVKDAVDKKEAIRTETINTLNDSIDYTERGSKIGSRLFDKFYGSYVFVLNLGLLVLLVFFLMKANWIAAFLLFAWLHTNMILNQIVRVVKIKIEEPVVTGEKII